ncbi:MAG: nucleotidyl transferase AbiEii/AbiGii toxin family protein [Actinobacteria bacterium]|nr:nucleotidyl transferase AbiEii/AbiGii toxin family protein [Actinomycetota bacterium]
MTLPAWLRAVLPDGTAETWEQVRSVVPDFAYLVGGTAIAVHLRHRVSRDLDFFLAEDTDLEALRQQLEAIGRLAVTLHTDDTLHGLFNRTRIQFLSAVHPPAGAGATGRGRGDPSCGDRRPPRDEAEGDRRSRRAARFFDLKVIETEAGRFAEEGLGLFVRRYRPRDADAAVRHLLLGLGYFEDVADDPFLPETREQILGYWQRRQPEIALRLNRTGGLR